MAQTHTEAAGKTTTKAWVGPSTDAMYCHTQEHRGGKKSAHNTFKNPACQASIKVFFLIDNQAEI